MSDLAMEREVQTLRLELEAAREQIVQLEAALNRQRTQGASRVSDAVSSIHEDLMKELAAPVSQLVTQAHLVDEGKPLSARDVVNVTRRVVRTLTASGLLVEGQPGEAATFDGERHQPLGDFHPQSGDPVVVRMPGVSLNGRRLHKASVGPVP